MYRITDWDPEDVPAWEAGNNNIARRNLIWSVVAEHIGFSVWSIWSVMVLFMPEAVYGFSAGDKFLLGATATLVGGCLRIPYTLATATFGGRNWTVFSAFVLLIPGINLALRHSYLSSHSATSAFWIFLAFYVVACAVTWVMYVRRPVPAPLCPAAITSPPIYLRTSRRVDILR
jgi:nitrate/nitrite transporter NarK